MKKRYAAVLIGLLALAAAVGAFLIFQQQKPTTTTLPDVSVSYNTTSETETSISPTTTETTTATTEPTEPPVTQETVIDIDNLTLIDLLPLSLMGGDWDVKHCQGIAVDPAHNHVYYSYTSVLVKCDLDGNILGTVSGFTGHLGDLALDDPARFTEDSPYRPSSPYSSTKAASDMLVRAWVRTYGLDATISNCVNNYGPRQHAEKLIPHTIALILRGERPQLYGDGRNVRDWIHVDDHSSAIWAILAHGRAGESYVVGAGCERSNLEIVRAILAELGQPADAFDLVADRPGHDRRCAVDASKLRRELGWSPAHADFEAGLAQTAAWYREHPEMLRR